MFISIQRRVTALAFAAGTISCVLVTPALATDRTKTPDGANFEAAHARNAQGQGITIGIIDLIWERIDSDFPLLPRTGGIIDGMVLPDPNGGAAMVTGHNLGARFLGNFDYSLTLPRRTPDMLAAGDGSDRHPTLGANIAAGSAFTITADPLAVPARVKRDFLGVAKQSNVYFGGVGPGFASLQASVDDLFRVKGATVLNYSVGEGAATADDAQGALNKSALFLDWFIASRDVTFVKSAGNRGGGIIDHESPNMPAGLDSKITKPGDFYNGITVGATDKNFRARAGFSSYHLNSDTGAAPDVRGKPDILAPGDEVWDGKNYTNIVGVSGGTSGTSFAAPHVTGAAALVTQKIAAGRKHEAVKAILLNSARKRHITGSNNGAAAVSLDHAATAMEESDYDYTDGVGFKPRLNAGKTSAWTPSEWSYAGGTFKAMKPLDDEQGTGVLDVNRAIDQVLAGEHAPGNVPHHGWSRHEFQRSSDAGNEPDQTEFDYKFAPPLTKGAFLTVTLCWDRMVNETDAGFVNANDDPGMQPTSIYGSVDLNDQYDYFNLTDLNLQVLRKNDMGGLDLYAESISTTDNVEHLHIPITQNGEYTIRVIWNGEDNAQALLFNTPFALAWSVPTPGTIGLAAIGITMLTIRRREKSQTPIAQIRDV